MKLFHIFIVLIVIGAFYVGINFEEVKDSFYSFSHVQEEQDYAFNNINESTEKMIEELEADSWEEIERLHGVSNIDSDLRKQRAEDGEVTWDEAMDVLEELFNDEGVKLNTIVQSDSNEEKFISHVAGTKGTTVIDSYWFVDKKTGVITWKEDNY